MLLDHIGYQEKAEKLRMALDICGQYEKKMSVTGRENGATGEEFSEYIMKTLSDPQLKQKWSAARDSTKM